MSNPTTEGSAYASAVFLLEQAKRGCTDGIRLSTEQAKALLARLSPGAREALNELHQIDREIFSPEPSETHPHDVDRNRRWTELSSRYVPDRTEWAEVKAHVEWLYGRLKARHAPEPRDELVPRDALLKAVECIREWHNTGIPIKQRSELWDIYWRKSPEMKPIREALSTASDYAPVTELTDYPRNDREQP